MKRTGSSSQLGSAVGIRYALPAEAQAGLDKRRRRRSAGGYTRASEAGPLLVREVATLRHQMPGERILAGL